MYRSHRFRARKSRSEDFKKLVLLLWSTVPLCLIPKPLPHLIVGVAWLLQLVFLLDPANCVLPSSLPSMKSFPCIQTSPPLQVLTFISRTRQIPLQSTTASWALIIGRSSSLMTMPASTWRTSWRWRPSLEMVWTRPSDLLVFWLQLSTHIWYC